MASQLDGGGPPPLTIEIPLTKGLFAIVDNEDYDLVHPYCWQATTTDGKTFYARTVVAGKCLQMHRLITGAGPGEEPDHIDGDGLNNTRANLRSCTHQQNIWRKRKLVIGTSKYKGVSRSGRQWRARIEPDRQRIELGRFDDELAAAHAYDRAARAHFGEFARTNFQESEMLK